MANQFAALLELDTENGASRDVGETLTLKSLVPDVKVALKDSNFRSEKNEKFPSLLACSSKYGYFVSGSLTGFQVGRLNLLRETINNTEKGDIIPFDNTIQVSVKEGSVDTLALTCDQLQLIVGVSGGHLLIYNLSDIIKNTSDSVPVQRQQLDADIISLQPNPEKYPDLLAVVTRKNECKLLRYTANETLVTIPNATSTCWSPLGKQFVCGTTDGLLLAYDIEGNQKDSIDSPPAQSGKPVNTVVWIENHVFLSIYTSGELDNKAYIINRRSEEKYTLLDDITPIYTDEGPQSHFYYAITRNFGKSVKTLITLANTASSELSIVGQSEDGSWATWLMGETTICLPLSVEDDYSDTYPVGLAIDYSATEGLPPYDSAESETPVPAMPVLLYLNNDGHVCAYHIYGLELARDGISYEHMVQPEDLRAIPEPSKAPASEVTESQAGGFAATPSKIPAFSSFTTSTPKTSSSFNNKPPTSTAAFGSPSTIGFGSVGFGSNAGTEQKVSFSALAAKASTPPLNTSGFGQSGFGSTAAAASTSTAAPLFGQTSSIGLAAKPAFGQTTSFGQSSTFGQPAFGQSSGFGQPGFGQSGFGQTAPFKQPSSFNSDQAIKSPFQSKAFGSLSDDKSNNETTENKSSPLFKPASFSVDKKKTDDSCSLSFDDVKKDLGGKNAFGLSGISDALNQTKQEDSEDSVVLVSDTKDEEEAVTQKKHVSDEKANEEHIEENFETIERLTEQETKEYESSKSIKPLESGEKAHYTDDELKSTSTEDHYAEEDETEEDDNEEIEEDDEEADESDEEHNDEEETDEEEYDDEELDEDELKDEQPTAKAVATEKPEAREVKELSPEESAEEKLTAEEKQKEDARIEAEKREKQEQLDKERKEKERIEEEERKEKERLAKAGREEQARLAEEKRKEDERIAKLKREEEERLAEIARKEKARIEEEERLAELKRREEEEKRIAAEKLAALKRTVHFPSKDTRNTEPTSHKRADGIDGIAKMFEAVYFDTTEDLESTTHLQNDIHDHIAIHSGKEFPSDGLDILEEYDYVWKMDDMYYSGNLLDKLFILAEKANADLAGLSDSAQRMADYANELTPDDIESCLENEDNVENLQEKLEKESIDYISSLETKALESKDEIKELEQKLEDYKKTLNAHKRKAIDESKLTLYALLRTIRDIEKSISMKRKEIVALEAQELSLQSTKTHPSSEAISSVFSPKKTNHRIQRKTVLNQLFQSSQQTKPLYV